MTQPWPYDPINTHVDDALGRFTSQYDDMPVMQGVARVFAERMQALEGSAYELLTQRWINTAQGEQLDRIGETVGEYRMAREDEAYRAAIKIRIGLNRGSGEPESVILVMNQLLENATYHEDYPAGVLIATNNEPITLQDQRGIVSVTPAGIRVSGLATLNQGGIRVGSATMGGSTTTIQPYFTGLLEQSMFAGRGVATGASIVSQVYPELPAGIMEQSVRQGRFAAHGGTTITQINPE